MRRLIILMAALPMPAMAQQSDGGYDQGGLYEGVFASHRTDGDNGSVRVGGRLGGNGSATTAPADAPNVLTQPSNSDVNVYKPRSLNDLAIEWKKTHPKPQ